MKKLKQGDRVLLINIKNKSGNRHHHEGFIDTVSHSNGGKIKLEKNNLDDFTDDGKHRDSSKFVIHLKQHIFEKLMGGLKGNINKITSIKLDDAMITAMKKELDND